MSEATQVFEAINTKMTTAFDSKMGSLVSTILSAIATPYSALIVLWVIVTGILVMRGEIDTRRGITRIIRVAFVSAFILEAGIYNSYIVQFFHTGLPNWIASTVSGGSAGNTPQLLDQIWTDISSYSATIDAQLYAYEITDMMELAIIAFCDGVLLCIVFAIYICAQVMTDVIVTIGPFVIAGFLFDATRNISEKWIGKLVGLALLSALVDVSMTLIAHGISDYMTQSNLNAVAQSGTAGIAIGIMFNTMIFIAVSAFIVIMLPSAAAFIGGGVSINPAGAIMNTVIGGATGGASTVAKAGAGIGTGFFNRLRK